MSDSKPAPMSAEKQALLALRRMKARVEESERARREPIAIVGLGCRFPGGVTSPDEFWTLLRDGTDAIEEVPADRWNLEEFYDSEPGVAGKMCTRFGGFVEGIDRFDPQFFGMAPREAVSLDPQQRLVLEVTWEALEDAGIAADRLAGTDTGVFVGISTQDYAQFQLMFGAGALDTYFGTGNAVNAVAGRLSYVLGLQGPSLAVDTACSSSLTTVHLACQSLRAGECRIALAGGVNSILLPEVTASFSRARMMAPDGRCKTFDAAADGYVRGEGCGMVVLKRLSDAEANGDRILAIIRGSAINQDGRSTGFTAPNERSQEELIRRALSASGVAGSAVDYVEAHGTGTALGDPIEVQALASALGEGRPADRPIRVGSVKSNIGHLEAAAGIAGLMKVVLALGHDELPASLHFNTPNPYIPWSSLPVEVVATRTRWTSSENRRVAGVSAFGFTGMNAHVIVEEAPAATARAPRVERPMHLVTLSAKTPAALTALAARHVAALDAGDAPALGDLAFTANVGRSPFEERLVVMAASHATLRAGLVAAVEGVEAPALVRGTVIAAPKVGFAFTGQGSQYAGMGRTLYATQPTFRAALDRCAALLNELPQPLVEVLYPAEGTTSSIDETGYAQPALFAIEYALAELWRSWGMQPAVVLGHSIGEYVAACVAGVFSLEDALRLVAARGRLMQALPAGGTMAAVGASAATVRAALVAAPAVALAAINGPTQVVIAGPQADVARVVATLDAQGIRAQRLTTSHGFHSALLEPMLDAFEAVAQTVTYHAPQIPVISNVTGQVATGDELVTPGYWRRHARSTVQWATSLQTLETSGCGVVVEIGPTATLTALGQSQTRVNWWPSLRRGRDDWSTLLDAVAQVYVAGAPIDWAGFDRDYVRRKVALPTYPFQRERYWVPFSRQAMKSVSAGVVDKQHPWLGKRTDLGSGETIFEIDLSCDAPSFLADHRVLDAAIVPASMFVEMVLAAAGETLGTTSIEIADLAIDEALMLGPGAVRTTQLLFRPGSNGGSFEIFSRATSGRVRGEWRRHASGRVSTTLRNAGELSSEGLNAAVARCSGEVPSELLYPADALIQLGPAFRGVQRLWRTDEETLGEISLPGGLGDLVACHAHPALLDACIQVVGPLLPEGDLDAAPSAFVLLGIDRLHFKRILGPHVWSHVSVRSGTGPASLVVADLRVYGADKRESAVIEGLRFRRVRRDTLVRAMSPGPDCLYTLAWERQPRPLPDDSPAFRPMAAVAADGLKSFNAHRNEHGLERYQRFVAELDDVSIAYVTKAMRDLGWTLEAGDIVDPRSLAVRLGVLPKLERLWNRLFEMLGEAGIVESTKIGMKVTGRAPAVSAENATADLRDRHRDREADIDVFQRCASRLADVLRGAVDPLQLLFPGASLDAVEQLVQHTPVARTLNAVVRDTVAAAIERLPSTRPLRILEIGAGTGGTTACVVPMLPVGRVEYVFTDVSPIFLARARTKFGDYPFMRYATLDIERDPIGQEFAAHYFDIVIAANVIHATRDLRQTLANVQQLLASNGMLALLEVVQCQRAVDLTFGLTDGWWRFADVDLRPTYPLLPSADWIALLRRAGFASAEAVPSADASDMPPQAVIISQGPSLDSRVGSFAHTSQQAAWVVVGSDSVAAALVQLIGHRGDRCVAVSAAEGFDQVLRSELASGIEIRGVVRVGSLFSAAMCDLSAEAFDRAVAGECRTALSLVQSLIRADLEPKPRCWFVTRNTQPAGEAAPIVPVQAPVWGLARSFAVEHPELWGGVIDIDDGAPTAIAHAIFDEISSGTPEDTVAFRGPDRFVCRLAASPKLPAGEASFRTDGEYLITGGTGGMALKVARWMAERGACHVSLAARRAPAPNVVAVVERIQAETGAQVSFVRADVSDESQMAAALCSLRDTGRALRGIVHCAGVFDDRVLLNHDWPRFERVLAPKVKGAWVLHEQTKSDPLDFFVLFSSAASVLPGSGLSNYAAANAFLDALAHYRRSLGQPALSVNWCPWADTGMAGAVGGAREGQWNQAGLSTITSDEGLSILSQTLRGSEAQYAVLPIDWTKYLQRFAPGARPALLSHVAPAIAETGSVSGDEAGGLRSQVERALAAQRHDVILAHVRDRVGDVLGFGGGHRIDPERGLFDIGLDSLTAVELKNVLQKSVGQPLPSTLVFDYPSVQTLSGFIAREVFHMDPPHAAAVDEVAPAVAVVDDGQNLSEDELADLLVQKLSRMQS